MCGISGSGKTHYAQELEKTGYIRLSSDALIWEKAGPGLSNLPDYKQKQLFMESRREILCHLASLLKSGKRVVVDATNCKYSSRNEIRRICSEVDVKPQFIYCQADKEVLWQRLSQRKGSGPDDLIVSSEQLADYWEGFERPHGDENDFIFLYTGSHKSI